MTREELLAELEAERFDQTWWKKPPPPGEMTTDDELAAARRRRDLDSAMKETA